MVQQCAVSRAPTDWDSETQSGTGSRTLVFWGRRLWNLQVLGRTHEATDTDKGWAQVHVWGGDPRAQAPRMSRTGGAAARHQQEAVVAPGVVCGGPQRGRMEGVKDSGHCRHRPGARGRCRLWASGRALSLSARRWPTHLARQPPHHLT